MSQLPGPAPGNGTGDTVFAIHQANYLPWLGFFSKMAGSDVFVFLDAVQYPRGKSFAARNRIKTSNGPTYLTIPVSVPKGNEGRASYLDVRFVDDRWRNKHLRTLELSYRKAPYYDEIMDLYRSALDAGDTFIELTIGLIEAVAAYLGIDTRTVRLSELLPEFGQKTQLIVDIAGAVGGDVYLSGAGGGHDYNDEQLLNDNGVALTYSAFEPPEYPQQWGPYESHLSAIDALFNCGPATADLIKA